MVKMTLDRETLRRLDIPTPQNVRLDDLDNSSVFMLMLQGVHPEAAPLLALRNELRAAGIPFSMTRQGG